MRTIEIFREDRCLFSRARHADGFLSRTRGLLLRPELAESEGLLITPCTAIHMWGMLFSIDLLWLDAAGRILKTEQNVRPWQIRHCRRAWGVLELRCGSIERHNLVAGQRLSWSTLSNCESGPQVWSSHTAGPEQGAGAVEFLIAAPVVLLLLLGTLQTSLLYQARLQLEVATQDAARAGALHEGNLDAIRDGLARGLVPLYSHGQGPAAYAQALARAKIAAAGAQIEILSPTREAVQDFREFGRLPLDDKTGQAYGKGGNWGWAIPDSQLGYRQSNLGSASGLPIQDANLLKIKITYHQPLIMPLIDRIFARFDTKNGRAGSVLGSADGGTGAFATAQGAVDRARGTFPLTAEATYRMQTPFTALSNTPNTSKLLKPQAGSNQQYDPDAAPPGAVPEPNPSPISPMPEPNPPLDDYVPGLQPAPDFSNAC